jgi:hypothetical protein
VAGTEVQKVTGTAGAGIPGTCGCDGELVWTKLVLNRARMVKACVKCGAIEEKGRS